MGFVAVHRGIDQGMVQERHALLGILVPVQSITGVIAEIFRVESQGQHQAGLVVRGTPHPAVGQAGPLGDRLALRNHVLAGFRHFKIGMRKTAVTGIRIGAQVRVLLIIMQRVVKAGHHPGGIAKGRVFRHVRDPLPVDPDLPVVLQVLEKFRAGIGAYVVGDGFQIRPRLSPFFRALYSSGLSALLYFCTAIFRCRITGCSATGGDAISAG